MKILKGKVAAITGAGSGIGRALAIELAEKGCHLAISDVDIEELEETACLISKYNITLTTHLIDVADRQQVLQYAEDAVHQHGRVHIIINGAGVSFDSTLEQMDYDDFDWIVGINFRGVVHGTKSFLPYMKDQPEGHIVNIASVNRIEPKPGNGSFCASKYAVIGFTECLMQEFHGTSIGVTSVYPAGVKALYKVRGLWEPQQTSEGNAAKIIIKAVLKNRQRVKITDEIKAAEWLTKFFPVSATRMVRRLAYSSANS